MSKYTTTLVRTTIEQHSNNDRTWYEEGSKKV